MYSNGPLKSGVYVATKPLCGYSLDTYLNVQFLL